MFNLWLIDIIYSFVNKYVIAMIVKNYDNRDIVFVVI